MKSAEQKRTLANVAVIGLFLIAIYVPFFGSLAMEDQESSAVERRTLATLPAIPETREALAEFPQAYGQYFDDHFGFRENLLRIYYRAKHRLGDSPSAKVVIGKEGWLFLADRLDGDPIGDFRNINRFTPQELEQVRAAIQVRYRWLRDRGIHYVFVISPNKHSIYPEYLPDHLTKVGENSAYDQLVEVLRREPAIPVIDLRPALLDAKKSQVVYSKIGTHWNQYGANVAQNEIVKHLAERFADVRPTLFGPESYDWSAVEHGVDLARMMGLDDRLAITGPEYTGASRTAIRTPAELATNRTRFVTRRDDAEANVDVVVFRDSFFTAMQPDFSEHFASVTYIWSMPSFESLQSIANSMRPDVVIEERAERYLPASARTGTDQ